MCLDYACHSQILYNQPVSGNDQNKPYGLLSDPTFMILYLCKSD